VNGGSRLQLVVAAAAAAAVFVLLLLLLLLLPPALGVGVAAAPGVQFVELTMCRFNLSDKFDHIGQI